MRSKNLSIEWTQHLKEQQRKQDFEKMLRNNTTLFDRLFDIFTEWENELLRAETKPDYSSPAWSHLQAHRNGNREVIKRAKDLIGFYK